VGQLGSYLGCLDVTGIIGNMVLVNPGLRTRKNFSENYPKFGHAFSEVFDGSLLGQKSLKNISLKGLHIISLPKILTFLRPALVLPHMIHL
jgi:hypothetical protein